MGHLDFTWKQYDYILFNKKDMVFFPFKAQNVLYSAITTLKWTHCKIIEPSPGMIAWSEDNKIPESLRMMNNEKYTGQRPVQVARSQVGVGLGNFYVQFHVSEKKILSIKK